MNLTELQKADPDLVADIAADLAYFDGHILFGKEKIPEFEERIEQAIIQAGIQRSIEKRGWAWGFSVAFGAGNSGVISIDGGQNFIKKHGNSPAEALLAAYLEAIHAT